MSIIRNKAKTFAALTKHFDTKTVFGMIEYDRQTDYITAAFYDELIDCFWHEISYLYA